MLRWLIVHWLGMGARHQPLRTLVQIGAIAAGVALGYAVHLINASALAEFAAAVRQASGEADAALRSRDGRGFDELWLTRVRSDPQVRSALPLLEVNAALSEPERARGRTLRIVGIDALRGLRFGSPYVGRPPQDAARFALLDDGLYLSPAAMTLFGVDVGDSLVVQLRERTQQLRVAGRLPGARAGEVVAAMDLAFAQWRLDRLGELTRIDLLLDAATALPELRHRLQLPAQLDLEAADAAGARVSNLSRAYRVNLNVLALVALFTGAFLVYSLQAQAVLARRAQLAFLRVSGLTRAEVERLLVIESLLLGCAGALLGLLFGVAIAAGGLALLGGDLGGGYFGSARPSLVVDPLTAAVFFALGVIAAVVGGFAPAREAAATAPALALKSGSGLDADDRRASLWPVLAMLTVGLLLLVLPSYQGIALAAYGAIALLLFAAIRAKPWLAPRLFAPLARWIDHLGGARVAGWLATTRLAATPRFASIGAAGIVASFALMVAMATMVASFRASVDDWLSRVLPAELYVRAGPSNASAAFSQADIEALRNAPGVARVDLSRTVKLSLDAQRADVTLIVRPLDRDRIAQQLPLTGSSVVWQTGQPPPVWVSEAIVALYDVQPGASLRLPIAGTEYEFLVAGVWRDYARQFGAIAIDSADYEALTGDRTRTDAALWLAPDARVGEVIRELRELLETTTAEFAEPGEIRAISLRIFDRSFAVTYVLQLAAILIGLVGIAATFSAQALVRAREFGVLRHLGVTRGEVLRLLAYEGLLVTALAVALGLAAGLAIAWILVDFVNPQSFHWTMDLRVPWPLIGALVAGLLGAASLTARLAGRRAVAPSAIAVVHADW